MGCAPSKGGDDPTALGPGSRPGAMQNSVKQPEAVIEAPAAARTVENNLTDTTAKKVDMEHIKETNAVLTATTTEEGSSNVAGATASNPEHAEFPTDPLHGRTFQEDETLEEVELQKGMKYRGEWKNGKQHGVGRMTYPDGGWYLGEFTDGKAAGLGSYCSKDGAKYEGAFADGKANGYGVYVFEDGSTFYGNFVDDKREGRGKEVQSDGLIYIGDYSKGQKNGMGKILSPNGESYEGAFANNEIHGLGRYSWPDGRVYDGEWYKNKQHGQAVFTWADGRVYKGAYSEGKIQGKGVLTWPDGRKYDGQWKNGLQDGEGNYYAVRGEYRRAQFLGGVRVKWLSEPILAPDATPESADPVKVDAESGAGGRLDQFLDGKPVSPIDAPQN